MSFAKYFYICSSVEWVEEWRSQCEEDDLDSLGKPHELPKDPLGQALYSAFALSPEASRNESRAVSLWKRLGGYSARYFGIDSSHFEPQVVLGNSVLEAAFDRGSDVITDVLSLERDSWPEICVYSKEFSSRLLLVFLDLVDARGVEDLGEVSSLSLDEIREISNSAFLLLGYDAAADSYDDS